MNAAVPQQAGTADEVLACRDDTENPSLPLPSFALAAPTAAAAAAGTGVRVTSRPLVRATATQLVSSEVNRARTAWFGRTYMDQLYICLHPASQQGSCL